MKFKIVKFYLTRYLYYKFKFKNLGFKSYLINLLRIDGMKNIEIGDRVIIRDQTWLAALAITNHDSVRLKIGNGTALGHFNHIYATKEINIGNHVLIADKVYISDNLHEFEDIHKPIIQQGIKQISTVHIGDGSWIGENVVILGATIGKNSIVGANSVVKGTFPDYCVIVGSPAFIVKRYDIQSKQWRKTDRLGNFE